MHILIISYLLIAAVSVYSAPSTAPCVIDLCTEADGAIAVYLTDTTCSANAVDYLTSKCGVGYSGTTCTVDCGSIYSWYGSYWTAEGCSILGNPCGSAGECSSSVANVCQEAISASSASPSPTPQASSTSSGASSALSTNAKIGVAVGVTLGVCVLAVLCCACRPRSDLDGHYVGRSGAGGGGGGGGFSSSGGYRGGRSGGSYPVVPSSPAARQPSPLGGKRRSWSPIKRPSSPARSPSSPGSGPGWGKMDESDKARADYVNQSQLKMQRGG